MPLWLSAALAKTIETSALPFLEWLCRQAELIVERHHMRKEAQKNKKAAPPSKESGTA